MRKLTPIIRAAADHAERLDIPVSEIRAFLARLDSAVTFDVAEIHSGAGPLLMEYVRFRRAHEFISKYMELMTDEHVALWSYKHNAADADPRSGTHSKWTLNDPSVAVHMQVSPADVMLIHLSSFVGVEREFLGAFSLIAERGPIVFLDQSGLTNPVVFDADWIAENFGYESIANEGNLFAMRNS